MKKRKHLIEMFSTFLEVNEPRNSIGPDWLTESRLKQNMIRMIQADPDAREEYWTLYWLREALTDLQNSQARSHLSAYLEEVCYWTTLKIFQEVANITLSHLDCFFIARGEVANTAKLFKRYNNSRSSIKTYAKILLRTALLEKIRSRNLEKYTPPALLRVVTKKNLKEALQKAGIAEPEFSSCLLARQCFRNIYIPTKAAGSQKLLPPSEKQLAAIAEMYNQLKKKGQPDVKGQDIEKMLDTCVQAVRSSLRIRNISLEECVSEPALMSNDPLDELDEPANEWQQITLILSKAFTAQVPITEQTMLKLWYGFAFRQADLGKLFGKQQYQISRQFSRCQQTLLKALAEWSIENWGISLNSEHLDEMAKQLDGWLDWYCKAQFYNFLKATVINQLKAQLELLILYYGQNLNPQDVASKLKISELLVNQMLAQVKYHLQAAVKSHASSTLGIDLNSLSSADKRLAEFVETWLKNAPYATFQ